MKVPITFLESISGVHFNTECTRAYFKSTVFNYFRCFELTPHDGLWRQISRSAKEEPAKNWIDKGIKPKDLY